MFTKSPALPRARELYRAGASHTADELAEILGVSPGFAREIVMRLRHEKLVERVTVYRTKTATKEASC